MSWIHFKDLYEKRNWTGLPFAPFIYTEGVTNFYKFQHLISFFPKECDLHQAFARIPNPKTGYKAPVTTKEKGSHAMYYMQLSDDVRAWLQKSETLAIILKSVKEKISKDNYGKTIAANQITDEALTKLLTFIMNVKGLKTVIEIVFDIVLNESDYSMTFKENYEDICGLIVYLAISEIDFIDDSSISYGEVVSAEEIKDLYREALGEICSDIDFMDMSLKWKDKPTDKSFSESVTISKDEVDLSQITRWSEEWLKVENRQRTDGPKVGLIRGPGGIGKSKVLKRICKRHYTTVVLLDAKDINKHYIKNKEGVLRKLIGSKETVIIDALNELRDINQSSYLKLLSEICETKDKQFLIATRDTLVEGMLSRECLVREISISCEGIKREGIEALYKMNPSLRSLYPNQSMTDELLKRPLYYNIASQCSDEDSIRGRYGLFSKFYDREMKGDDSNLALHLAKKYIIPALAEKLGMKKVKRDELFKEVSDLCLSEDAKGYLEWLFWSQDDIKSKRIIVMLDQLREYGVDENSQDALTNPSILLDVILSRDLFEDTNGEYSFFHEDIADMLAAYRTISLEEYLLSCPDSNYALLSKLPDKRNVLDFYLEEKGIFLDVSSPDEVKKSVEKAKYCFSTFANERITPAIQNRSDEASIHLYRLALEMYETIQSEFKAYAVPDFDFDEAFAKGFIIKLEPVLKKYMYTDDWTGTPLFIRDIGRLSERILQNARIEGNFDKFMNLSSILLSIPEIENQVLKAKLDALQRYTILGEKGMEEALIGELINADGTLDAKKIMTEIKKAADIIKYPMSYNIGGIMRMYPAPWMLKNGFSISPTKSLEFYKNAIECDNKEFDWTYRQYAIAKALDLLIIYYDRISWSAEEKDATIIDFLNKARFLQIPLKNAYSIYWRCKKNFKAINFDDLKEIAEIGRECSGYMAYWTIRLIMLTKFITNNTSVSKEDRAEREAQIEECKENLRMQIVKAVSDSIDAINIGGRYDRKMALYNIFDVLSLFDGSCCKEQEEECASIDEIREFISLFLSEQEDSVYDYAELIRILYTTDGL